MTERDVAQAVSLLYERVTNECPDADTLHRASRGRLGDVRTELVREHVRICGICAWSMAQESASAADLLSSLVDVLKTSATALAGHVVRSFTFDRALDCRALVPRLAPVASAAGEHGYWRSQYQPAGGDITTTVELFGRKLSVLVTSDAPEYQHCVVFIEMLDGDRTSYAAPVLLSDGKGRHDTTTDAVARPEREPLGLRVTPIGSADALALVSRAASIEALGSLAVQGDAEVRAASIRLLGQSHHERARELLEAASSAEASPDVRQAALDAIAGWDEREQARD